MTTPIHGTRRSGALRKWGGIAAVVAMLGVTVWFFSRVWSNIDTLATRTLPGIGLAHEATDRAAGLEVLRLSSGSTVALGEGFDRLEETLQRYERTILVEQDRNSLARVRESLTAYRRAPSAESWQNLRTALEALHAFRHQRAMSYASDSREHFADALTWNVAGLAAFGVLTLLASAALVLTRPHEVRPDDF